MNYSWKKTLSLLLCLVLVIGLFAGCGKKETPNTTPSSEDNVPPGLVEVKDTKPTTPTTEATEPIDENAAVINKNGVGVRQTPSSDASPIGTLDKGTKVTVIREVSIAGVGWTLVREGWVKSEDLDRSFVPEPPAEGETPTIETPAQQNGGTTNNNNGGTTNNNNNNNNNKNNNNTGSNNNNAGTGTAANIKGVVTASELNIRKDASQEADRLGGYKYGDRVTIVETKNGWGRTDKGWVSLNYVYQDGTTGTNGCKGVIIGNDLNVRTGPGTGYDRVDSLNYGARVNILQRITLGNTTWGCIKGGWISMDYVYVDGTKTDNGGEGTCTGDNVNIRSGPGTNYDPVGSANSGDAITIYNMIEIGETTWGYVEKAGVKGWMSMAYANMG